MNNQAQAMYALTLDQCVDLIKAVGHQRTILMQGDMGTGKSSTLTTLSQQLSTHRAVYFDCTTKDLGDMMIPSLSSIEEDGCVRMIPPNQLTLDYLKEVNDYGASRLIYTDINRDGMKQSPNFEETAKVADTSNCPVIISGGVSSIDDIKRAKELKNKNIEGIIVGKAIYDGDIKLDELVKELDA